MSCGLAIDRRVLLDLISRLRQRAVPSRRKQTRVLSSRDLLHGALKHFDRVLSGTAPSQTIRASRVRNALMVAMLAVHPVRLANFTAIRHRPAPRTSAVGIIGCGSPPMRPRRGWPFETPFATILQEPLDTYLQRELGRSCWTVVGTMPCGSAFARPQYRTKAYTDQIVKTTERIFGRPYQPAPIPGLRQ